MCPLILSYKVKSTSDKYSEMLLVPLYQVPDLTQQLAAKDTEPEERALYKYHSSVKIELIFSRLFFLLAL